MKKFLTTGLLAGALLAGCGGTPTSTGTDAQSGAATAITGAENTGATAITGAPNTDGTSVDTTAQAESAANATAVTGVGASAPEATATGANDTRNTGPGADSTPVVATPQANTGTSGNTTGSTGGTMDMGSLQPAGIPELGLNFQVPEGFEKLPNENAWSPAGADLPRFGVENVEVTSDWRPSSMLPEGATVVSTQYLNLSSGQAQVYTVENSDGTAESHAIIRSGTTAYDFYARAATMQELMTIQPVLSQIVGSAQFGGV
jgi:hypothetical protein